MDYLRSVGLVGNKEQEHHMQVSGTVIMQLCIKHSAQVGSDHMSQFVRHPGPGSHCYVACSRYEKVYGYNFLFNCEISMLSSILLFSCRN